MEDFQENSSASCSSSSFAPDVPPLHYDPELWEMAEERIQEVLCVIQPAVVSDRSRKEIIDHVRMLIRHCYGIEVFPFGSVPLKTYLPDGDIDLTVLTNENSEEDLARDLCSILEDEEKVSGSQVRDITYVHAQVKVVKCTIRNIAVDISFNQVAGLCSLYFLEQVDGLIGKDHLYKRSTVLVKAWFYYESRILGAHTGLISTYAVSILVLYIINRFHSSLSSPLAVLYKFLDYYSTFDWDNFCVTINGPVLISSLRSLHGGSVENSTEELFLSQELLRCCREVQAAPTEATEANGQCFPIRHLNIVDPLRNNNNLGRSVTKGNYHRIRSALALGFQRLRDILVLPGEIMGESLENFFSNTLERNGKGQRPDVREPVAVFGTGRWEPSNLTGDIDGCYQALVYGQWYHNLWPSSTSQMFSENAWDIMYHFAGCTRNHFQGRATNTTVPRPLSSPPHLSHVAMAFGLCRKGNSRGTGTYIPKTDLHAYRNSHLRSSARSSTSSADYPFPESSKQSGKYDEDLPETNRAGYLNECLQSS